MMLLLIILLFLGILAAIGIWLYYQSGLPAEPIAPASQVQNISSPDGNLQAVIRNRPEDTFQVEVRRRRLDDSPDTGPTETWTLVYGPAITSTLEEAMDIANKRIGERDE